MCDFPGGLFHPSDDKQEVAFRYAVEKINANRDILLKFRLSAQIEQIKPQDSFHASKRGEWRGSIHVPFILQLNAHVLHGTRAPIHFARVISFQAPKVFPIIAPLIHRTDIAGSSDHCGCILLAATASLQFHYLATYFRAVIGRMLKYLLRSKESV